MTVAEKTRNGNSTVNIGLDFGTTYSVLAEIETNQAGVKEPRAISLFNEQTAARGGVYYDSLVLRDVNTDKASFGRTAHDEIGNEGKIAYRGFKLMLASPPDDPLRRAEGYVDGWMPERIVHDYLQYLLVTYKNKPENLDRRIGKLVIGVPYIWAQNLDDSAYSSLLKIVRSLDVASSVEYLSEPEAACGFFVENYRKYNHGEVYKGYLLLVDYGGGTLDITLCHVDEKSGKPIIKVVPGGRAGAGANTDRQIGKAGLAFMREVIRMALENAGVTEEDINVITKSGKLDRAAFNLENFLKEFSASINGVEDEEYTAFKERFSELDLDELDRLSKNKRTIKDKTIQVDIPRVFDNEVFWQPKQFPITYGLIAKAYKSTIFPVLNGELKKIKAVMDKNEIDSSFRTNNLKIQLIGGFCDFYPVEQQVLNFFKIAADKENDYRSKGILEHGEKRTLAVAFGAALKANDLTEYIKTFPYSIGVKGRENRVFNGKVEDVYYWAAEKGEDFIPNYIYLLKKDGNAIPCLAASIKELAYIGAYSEKPMKQKLRSDYASKLCFDVRSSHGYLMGISLDEYLTITFHWWEITNPSKFDYEKGYYEDWINSGKSFSAIRDGQSGKARLDVLLQLDGTSGVKNLLEGDY